MHKSLIIPFVMGSSLLYGGQNLSKDNLLIVPISCKGLARLAVRHTKIQDVVVYPESHATKVNLHKSGQLYINTFKLPPQFQLSLLLQNGVTQDLRLQCADIEQHPIILENNPEPFSPEEADFIEKTSKSVLKGEYKDGLSISIEDISQRKSSLIEWKPIQQWQKDSYRIQLYTGRNISSNSLTLKSHELKEEDDLAIAFDHDTVALQENVQMVIIRKIPVLPRSSK